MLLLTMQPDRKITELIQQLAGTHLADEVYILDCQVQSVSDENRTCDCLTISGKAVNDIPNVQLMASVDDGVYIKPTIGSVVRVLLSKRVMPQVTQFSEIDSIQFITGGLSYKMNSSGITLNDGSLGGLIKINELIKQINKTNDTLKSIVNILKGAPINEPGNGAPSALQTALKLAIATDALGEFSTDNLENKLITHGEEL